ncbi:MAG TPA: ABC transporter permease [Spirillospora sp.]|nr:ABC transporter permease [Spirillospora sp.]
MIEQTGDKPFPKKSEGGLSRWFRRRSQTSDEITEDEFQFLTVRQLMWRKFARNRMAVASGVVLILLYIITIFAGFFAPYNAATARSAYSFGPPQTIRFYDEETGQFFLRPFVYRMKGERNMQTFQLEYQEDRSIRDHLHLFVRGDSYRLFGLIESDLHLFGTVDEGSQIYLLGADQRGRDLFSRILYGGQVSLSVGIIGVLITVALGSTIGTLSGYLGGTFDNVVQRLIETLRSFPQLPMWMALSAAIPPQWPPEWVYAGIVVVLAFINWTGLAREVRGLVLSLRQRDFIAAAEAAGASTPRIVRKHMIPNMASHIIVTATLAIPGTILGESALSFLGIGVRPPMVSWGLLLNEAIRIQVIALHPWTLYPGLFILITVIAYNFLGDGLRDMVDPFSR